jgi:hypothetical protein
VGEEVEEAVGEEEEEELHHHPYTLIHSTSLALQLSPYLIVT